MNTIINGKQCTTQTQGVLEYLKTGRMLCQKTAYDEIGTQRLGAVIFQLRKKGFLISSTQTTERNRFGNSVSFVKYHLDNTIHEIQQLENAN
tara:strand:+ start:3939 stop:4214 length:276 start_codon:yes stop_codon:yes gene_type:complete